MKDTILKVDRRREWDSRRSTSHWSRTGHAEPTTIDRHPCSPSPLYPCRCTMGSPLLIKSFQYLLILFFLLFFRV